MIRKITIYFEIKSKILKNVKILKKNIQTFLLFDFLIFKFDEDGKTMEEEKMARASLILYEARHLIYLFNCTIIQCINILSIISL